MATGEDLVHQHPGIVRSRRTGGTDEYGIHVDHENDPATFLHVAVQRAPDCLDMVRLFATPEHAMIRSAGCRCTGRRTSRRRRSCS
jgi:hypothetical protein